MLEPLISIIMPNFNGSKTIEKSILSVINQTYRNFELIIVDDASVDNSNEIINYYCNKDRRIKSILLKKNNGVCNARKIAIENSNGNFIAFLDSDDYWQKDKLKNQISFMLANDVKFCFSDYEVVDEKNNILYEVKSQKYSYNYFELLKGNEIGCLTVIVSNEFKEILIKVLSLTPHHEDYLMWLYILKNNKIDAIKYDGKIMASYRISKKSLSGNKLKASIWTWDIYYKYEKLGYIKSFYYFSYYVYKNIKKRFIN